MLRLKQTLNACVFACILLQGVAVQAATYYVATTGHDSNPGTSTKPWRTVASAVSKMVAGDTTYVRGGIYNEGIIRFRRSGTQAAPIKLLNYSDESPIIHCIDPTQSHRVLIQHTNGENVPMGWITIEGFEIENCSNGIKSYSLHDSTIRRNWIHNSTGSGIQGNGTRVLIDRNVINHNAHSAKYPPGGHGIYMNGSNITITNNLIYDNRVFGVQQNGTYTYNAARHPGPEFIISHNWVVAHNTFAYQIQGAGIVVWGGNCHNTRIENNIFYENGVIGGPAGTNGVYFSGISSTTGVAIRNNLMYASGTGSELAFGTRATEGVHYTQSGNIVNTDNPRFVNAPATLPASPNFALTERSPAIDKGLPLAMTKIAFDGTSRPQGRDSDLGAYEYIIGGDSQSPAPVQNVQVK